MKRPPKLALAVALTAVLAIGAQRAGAHSASDAYLTLESATDGAKDETIVHGQWDIALRDLDFVLGLDDDGDGKITWKELRRHEAAIASYAFPYLGATADGRPCSIRPTTRMVDDHADGAYVALGFDITCAGAPDRMRLDYSLFFAVDPSHRCILVFKSGRDIATALLAPDNAHIELSIKARPDLVGAAAR
jgi:hypothetical protein